MRVVSAPVRKFLRHSLPPVNRAAAQGAGRAAAPREIEQLAGRGGEGGALPGAGIVAVDGAGRAVAEQEDVVGDEAGDLVLALDRRGRTAGGEQARAQVDVDRARELAGRRGGGGEQLPVTEGLGLAGREIDPLQAGVGERGERLARAEELRGGAGGSAVTRRGSISSRFQSRIRSSIAPTM